jgi:hypothetical protein
VSEEVAQWAGKKAAEQNTSVSKLAGKMLEDKMRATNTERRSRGGKKQTPIPGFDASKRLRLDEIYERR